MSLGQSVLCRESKTLATFGYIRHNSAGRVPLAINKLCLTYFDDIFYISIGGTRLQQFLQKKNGEFIERRFKYNNDISFDCEVFPNGRLENENGTTLFFIAAAFNKKNIISLRYNYEMECKQTNTHFIGYNHNTQQSQYYGWDNGCMQLAEYTNAENENNAKHLVFSVYININSIKYKHNKTWIEPFKMQKNYVFEWKLTEKLKQRIKNWPIGKSLVCDIPNNSCWVLSFAPRGFEANDDGKPCIELAFLKWCNRVTQIFGTDIIKTNVTNINKGNWIIDERQSCIFYPLSNDPFDIEKPLQFEMEIMLTQIVDSNGKIIEPTDNQEFELVFDNN